MGRTRPLRQWRLDHWGQGALAPLWIWTSRRKGNTPPLIEFLGPSWVKEGTLDFFSTVPPSLANLQAPLPWDRTRALLHKIRSFLFFEGTKTIFDYAGFCSIHPLKLGRPTFFKKSLKRIVTSSVLSWPKERDWSHFKIMMKFFFEFSFLLHSCWRIFILFSNETPQSGPQTGPFSSQISGLNAGEKLQIFHFRSRLSG